jgi:hypothetical protein
MKYIITESRLKSIIENWLNENYGDLERYYRAEYKEVYLSKNGRFKFMYNIKTKRLYIVSEVWNFITDMFGLGYDETAEILLNWCNNKFKFNAKNPVKVDEI